MLDDTVGATTTSDNDWATDRLPDDDIPVSRHEAVVAPLLEEGELDADAIVVSPTAVAANNGRRDEGWADLGLDQWFTPAPNSRSVSNNRGNARPAAGRAGN